MKLEFARNGEPVGSSVHVADADYRINLINSLNWYTREKNSKDARAYLVAWAKKFDKTKLAAVETTDQTIPVSFGWLARILTTGAMLSEENNSAFSEFVDSLQPRIAAPKSVTAAKPSIQDSIKEKSAELLGEFEGLLDDVKDNCLEAGFSVKKFLHGRNVGAPYLPYLKDWAKVVLAQYVAVYQTKDADLKEGYGNFKKKDIQRMMTFLGSVIEETAQYGQVKKANRKPRAKKEIPAAVQVKALKYKKEDPEFKLKSINPADIVGAQQLWVFNTKYRKLGVYRTDSALGLQVKGATLQNYLPEQSMQKTLRKPEAVLKQVASAGKVALRKVLDNVKGKELPLNGRIGSETIILRTVK